MFDHSGHQLTNISKGASENSDFSVRARKSRADDCMDAGDRVTQEAKTENRSVHVVLEDGVPFGYSSTELTPPSQNLGAA